MDREIFLAMTAPEIAEIVRAVGSPQVCVLPVNGSRSWFLLEHGQEATDDPALAYIASVGRRHIELNELCFDHGLDTLVTPLFGEDLLNRDSDALQNAAVGLSRLATHPDFLSFYQTQKVRVHFYGDYRKRLADTPYAYLCDLFDHISKHTAHHTKHRLFYGLFASDATESIAEMAVRHHQNTGQIPSRRALIEQYYGEYIEKADLLIGFEKFNGFDYPMLSLGAESLYFTAAPSLYMNERQIRSILYDYIYLRPEQRADHAGMSGADIETMRNFYQFNRESAFGVGEMHGGNWFPLTKF